MDNKKKPHTAGTGTASRPSFDSCDLTQQIIDGLYVAVFGQTGQDQPVLLSILTYDRAIPEEQERMLNQLANSYNIRTTILPEVDFRSLIRHSAALHSLGRPKWPAPCCFEEEGGGNGD